MMPEETVYPTASQPTQHVQRTSYQGLGARKPVSGGFNRERLKTACPASETSQNFESLPEASLDNIPCRERITNALTRLDCADA